MQQQHPFFKRNPWAAWLILLGMGGFAVWFFATGANCTDSLPDANGRYIRTCSGPDFGNDPLQNSNYVRSIASPS